MRDGQSAIRHPLRSIGLVSTVGSLSGTPPLGTEKRSCNALPKPAARDSLCPSPWAIVLWEASDRSTWPTPPCGCRLRRMLPALVWPRPVGPSPVAGVVRPPLSERRRSAMRMRRALLLAAVFAPSTLDGVAEEKQIVDVKELARSWRGWVTEVAGDEWATMNVSAD